MGFRSERAPEVGVAQNFRGRFAPILLGNPLFKFLATPLHSVQHSAYACVHTGAITSAYSLGSPGSSVGKITHQGSVGPGFKPWLDLVFFSFTFM